ncbi:MAG TPA: S41 family peptidase [Candidatus Doudnabacteria bacterium]|nr:S41 family peptidase [Candidatus Doudnabacteria bacterium]
MDEQNSNQSSLDSEPPKQFQSNMKHPFRNSTIMYLVVIALLFGVFRLGYGAGQSGYSFDVREFKIVNQSGQSVNVDYGLLWEAIDVVNRKYIDKDQIDQQQVLYGAISGAVRAAGDEYTEFFDPKTLAQFRSELQGTFSGIGAEIGKSEGNIVVVAPLADSPAEKAGLQAKDIIVKVDDQTVVDWNVDEAVSVIRGEAGTQVRLTIFREGTGTPFEVTITRAQIEIKSVVLTYREVNGRTVAILKMSRFGDDTERLLNAAITEIQGRNVAGIILDMRNNPGGYLETSVDVSSEWLERGKLVVTEARSDSDTITFNSSGSNRLGNYKTVVLINGGSASASEIVAGALKDNGKAVLVGEQSFGKGSVQELIPLRNDTAVKVTIAKWITPSGQNLNQGGIEPDIKVEITPEDIEAGRDPQLDRALEEILR